jgi:hypothetical protein
MAVHLVISCQKHCIHAYIYIYIHRIDCPFGDFPAKHTIYTPYVYMILANPKHMSVICIGTPKECTHPPL